MDPISLILVAVIVVMLLKPDLLGGLFASSRSAPGYIQAPPAAAPGTPPLVTADQYNDAVAAGGVSGSPAWFNKCYPQRSKCEAGGGTWTPFPQDPNWDGHSVPGTCGRCGPAPEIAPLAPAPIDPQVAYGSCPDRLSCQGAPVKTVQLSNPSPSQPAPASAVQTIAGANRAGALFGRTGALFKV